jgi:prepilin-type N-terminal cleavage/methylation domain-containing protein
MQKRPDFRSGFTLVELLVTVGIAGVLMSLTFTAVGRSVLKSHATVSKNNLRQITAAYIGVDMETGVLPSFNQTRRGKWVEMIHDREGYPEEVFSSPASYVRHRTGEGNAREDWRMTGPESTYQHITRI